MKIEVFISREIKPDLVSRLIMWKLKIDFSHIGFIVDDQYVFHSTADGFNQDTIKYFPKNGKEIKMLKDISHHIENHDYAKGYLQGRIGIEYSTSQYIGFIFKGFRKLFRNGNEKGICSEEVMRFIDACCHVKAKAIRDFDYYDPKMAWDYVESLP